ncbi:MAG: isoleucine--tRNA ligase, partial [Victivallales bacterium]|nr:isoleucine--tRNA ligase [Victivallales bacterium]
EIPELAGYTPYVLIWTTTPWTLPSNLAVCVGPEMDYAIVRDGDSSDAYILAKSRLEAVFRSAENYTILKECKGSDLVGITYEPIFDWCADKHPEAYRVVSDSYVTDGDGTGMVHIAPAYGEDDYRIGVREGIKLVDPLDDEGCFTAAVPQFAGMQCKDADKHIIKWLKENGKLVRQDTITHSYPFCERTETPLIYKAIDAWYVRVEDLREELLANTRPVRWQPDFVGTHRFANWLADARDWNISRNRFWGSCIPLWINTEDPEDIICIGSVAELEELSGEKVTDLHKHFIDKIEIHKDGKTYRRTPEVLDCWFESGSMPYAQSHYPFENKEFVEKTFPADFIAEGLDQTRGWFYSLMLLSTAIFKKPPYQNVVVNGLILAEDGHKMSKRLKNYPDPLEVVGLYGADALRLCMLSSPVVRAEDLRFSESAVREIMRTILIPLWNSYSFLAMYARIDKWTPQDGKAAPPANPANVLDRWILSRLSTLVTDLRETMDAYDLQKAAGRFTGFIEELTNWYIRRSRRRFWKSTNDGDKAEAYQTLHYVLLTFCKLAAPFIPFITENIYRNLRTEEMPISVHMCDYPEADLSARDDALNRRMANTMSAVSLGRLLRSQTKQKVRQPLAECVLVSLDANVREDLTSMADVIAEELNVKKVTVESDEEQ